MYLYKVVLVILGFLLFFIFHDIFVKIFTPFFIAFIIANLLQPTIAFFVEKHSFSKKLVSLSVFALFLAIFIIFVIVLLPLIYRQISSLVNKIAFYSKELELIQQIFNKVYIPTSYSLISNYSLQEILVSSLQKTFLLTAALLNNFWSYMLATINAVILFIFLIPLILFYFLRDWDVLLASTRNLFSKDKQSRITNIFNSINKTLFAYIRGQVIVCFLLSIYYTIGLCIIKMDFSLLLGIFSGILSVIPFIGFLAMFFLATILCYLAYGISIKLLLLVGLYILGYILDSLFITPKVLSNKIGLHPLWIIFAIFAGNKILGISGMLFSIPIASIIKVLLLKREDLNNIFK